MRLMGRNIAGAILRCRSEPTIQIRMENGTKRNKCRRILNSREALTNRILSSMGSSGRRWDRWFTNPTTDVVGKCSSETSMQKLLLEEYRRFESQSLRHRV